MAFLALDYFPPNEAGNYCLQKVGPEALLPYTPLVSLEEAMYIWWTINKIRYTYSWYYVESQSGITITVVGEGSVVMSGGIDTMSEKICPQVSYYTCYQNVIYTSSYENEVVETNDSVILAIDSRPVKYVDEQNIAYIPPISLTICSGRRGCYFTWATTEEEAGNVGLVDFFGLYTLPLSPTVPIPGFSSYAVSIALSVESTSEPV